MHLATRALAEGQINIRQFALAHYIHWENWRAPHSFYDAENLFQVSQGVLRQDINRLEAVGVIWESHSGMYKTSW